MRTKIGRFVAAFCASAVTVGSVTVVVATGAAADIVATTGQVTEIPPPPSAKAGDLESDITMFAFDEQQDVVLSADLAVDITAPGTYDDSADLTPGVIPAGTVVSSHLVHADKVGIVGPSVTLEGTVSTDEVIVGIAILGGSLDGSDFLGAPGTQYPRQGIGVRRLNLDRQDEFVVEYPDRQTVLVHVTGDAHFDQVRIITTKPEPLGAEGCTPGYWKQKHHFDSWTSVSPGSSFEAVFAVEAFPGDPSLLDVLKMGGGGTKALGRHGVAALLNALNADVEYGITSTAVRAAVRNAILSGDKNIIEGTKNLLDTLNQAGCPIS